MGPTFKTLLSFLCGPTCHYNHSKLETTMHVPPTGDPNKVKTWALNINSPFFISIERAKERRGSFVNCVVC